MAILAGKQKMFLHSILISSVLVVVLGTAVFALNKFISKELEDGTVSNPSLVVNDTSASNGKTIKFATPPVVGDLTSQDLINVKSKKNIVWASICWPKYDRWHTFVIFIIRCKPTHYN